MGTSIENGGGGEGGSDEEHSEEMIPWSCVDDFIRDELIHQLNPENTMSGNWRGLASRLGFTTREIASMESEKDNNTRLFFKNYDQKVKASYNAVYSYLKEMDRQDCLRVLDKYLPRIKNNHKLEKENEARLLQVRNDPNMPVHSHHRHPQHACGGCACSNRTLSSQAMCNLPSHTVCDGLNHRGFNCNASHYHMPMDASRALQMSNGPCPAGCIHHSPTKHCSYPCSQCGPPHTQLDIGQTTPKCLSYCHHSSSNSSTMSHMNTFFSDCHRNLTNDSPNSYLQYYNGRSSIDANNKPYNFSLSGSLSAGVRDSNHRLNRGHSSLNWDGEEGQRPPVNMTANSGLGRVLPDNISPHFNSVGSNENNTTYPEALPSPGQFGTTDGPYSVNSLNRYQGDRAGGPALPGKPIGDVNSKKSLQKLTEMSKMPNHYQPTKEYKHVVADHKIDNKKHNKKQSRGNGSITNSSSSHAGPLTFQQNQSTSQPNRQEELLPMAGLSIGQSSTLAREVGRTSNEMSSNVFVTYSKDGKSHHLEILRLTIFLADNNMSVFADVDTDPAAMVEGSLEGYQEFFSIADFILVCISPKYLADIGGNSPPPPPSPTRRPIHTYEIYHMMKAEHQQRSLSGKVAGKQPLRTKAQFASLLFGDTTDDQVPAWLRNNYPVYKWPSQFKDIGWFLKRPRERISAHPYG